MTFAHKAGMVLAFLIMFISGVLMFTTYHLFWFPTLLLGFGAFIYFDKKATP